MSFCVDLVVIVYPSVEYASTNLPARLVPWLFPYPWTGIWNGPEPLQAGSPTGSGLVFRAQNCRAVIVPDPGLRDRLLAVSPGWRILAMPEIADLRPPGGDLCGIRLLRERAGGRRIVGLLGNINRRKGIFTLLEMAALAWTRGLSLFFVAAGDFSLNSCGDEYPAIAEACRGAPDNFLLLPDRIADGPAFNAYIAACDVVFASYLDFPFQSNLLTKAAAFSRPVIVSQGHIMEERTVEYGLGLAVPQANAEASLVAVHSILKEGNPRLARWADYLRANGVEELDRMLTGLLEHSPALERPIIPGFPKQPFEP